MLILVLDTCKRHLPNSATKNTPFVTSFLNYIVFNLIDKLVINIDLSLENRTFLKLYI